MADKSSYWRDAVINVLNGTGISGVTPYVSLHTSDPGLTGSNEVSGGSYARQSASFSSASSGATATTGTLTYTSMPAVTVTHVGIWDAVSGGNFLYGDALAASQIVNAGGTFEFPTGNITVSEA